jgi:two-component system, OmpR family, osmolarity sensor histidine kinase EnvZ
VTSGIAEKSPTLRPPAPRHWSSRLWPGSLLWRTVLLITLLLIVASIAWLQIFRLTEREPRARQVAQQVASVVNLTRAALITAQPSKRFSLLSELSRKEGIQIYVADTREAVPPLPNRPFLQIVAAELRRDLGPDTRITLSREGVRGLWVSFQIDGDEFWVMLPRSRIERSEPLRWAGWAVLVLILALAGAFLIVARINRPLRELTRAAEQMSRGATPQPVDERGPSEIRTLARSFNHLADDLRRLDDERAFLLAGVSHDLRTPLARIRLGMEMMGDGADPALIAGMEQDIQDIDGAIGQFLDFARLRDAEPAVPAADLNALVQSVAERYARAGKPLKLDLQPVPPPVPPLALRPQSFSRLVANLIDNALRHAGDDIDLHSGTTSSHAYVEVADRGAGIPPDRVEHMLQPFTRLDSARGGAGTGLGLAIVDRIARMHGGAVHLLPRAGGGLVARVEIPLTAGAQPEPA